MTRIFVDTNVLFPFSVMDLMPALTENGVHEVLWTQALLADEKRHPPMTPVDRSNSHVKAGLPAFAQRIQVMLADQ